MMTCREASTLVSSGSLSAATWRERLAVRLHLLMCGSCRAFKRQMDLLGAAARKAGRALDDDAPPDLEARLKDKLNL